MWKYLKQKTGRPLDATVGIQKIAHFIVFVTHPTWLTRRWWNIGIEGEGTTQKPTMHEHTFNNRGTPNDTSLSKYIWSLKDAGISDYSIRWSISRRAAGYSKSTKKCGLCLAEKLLICEFQDKDSLRNDKSELVSKCRHLNKHLLKSCKEE